MNQILIQTFGQMINGVWVIPTLILCLNEKATFQKTCSESPKIFLKILSATGKPAHFLGGHPIFVIIPTKHKL